MITLRDFYADWCSPCRIQFKIIKKIKDEFGGDIRFENIDIDKNKDLVKKFSVSGVPTIILEKDKEERERFVGITPGSELRRALLKLIKES